MADGTKVWVSIPEQLLARLDHAARVSGISRDDALRRAVESFVGRSGESRLGAAMAEGYKAMAKLNLSLAEEDAATLADWPVFDGHVPEADLRGDS